MRSPVQRPDGTERVCTRDVAWRLESHVECAPVPCLECIRLELAQQLHMRVQELQLIVHSFVGLVRAHARWQRAAIAHKGLQALPYVAHLDMRPGRALELVEAGPDACECTPDRLETLNFVAHVRQTRVVERVKAEGIARLG